MQTKISESKKIRQRSNLIWSLLGAIINKMLHSLLTVYQTSEDRLFFPSGSEFSWIFWVVYSTGYLARILYTLILSPIGQGKRMQESQIYAFLGILTAAGFSLLPSFGAIGWCSTISALLFIMLQHICSSCDYPFIFINTVELFPEEKKLSLGILHSLFLSLVSAFMILASKVMSLQKLGQIITLLGILFLGIKHFLLAPRTYFEKEVGLQNPMSWKEGKKRREIALIILPTLIFVGALDHMSFKWWAEMMVRERVLTSNQMANLIFSGLCLTALMKFVLCFCLKDLKVEPRLLMRYASIYSFFSLPLLYILPFYNLGFLGVILNLPISIILKENVSTSLRLRLGHTWTNKEISSAFNILTSFIQPIIYIVPPLLCYNCPNLYGGMGPWHNSLIYCFICSMLGFISTLKSE